MILADKSIHLTHRSMNMKEINTQPWMETNRKKLEDL